MKAEDRWKIEERGKKEGERGNKKKEKGIKKEGEESSEKEDTRRKAKE